MTQKFVFALPGGLVEIVFARSRAEAVRILRARQ